MDLARGVALALAIAVSLGPAVMAQDFDKGMAAYEAGDYAAAFKQWRPLAEQGDSEAQVALGFMYGRGLGVQQDYQESVNWYQRAAEQGDAHAQFSLGYIYCKGNGVLQDNVRANMWYNIAPANGSPQGAKNRGNLTKTMPAADVSLAQNMARECMSSGYKNCGW
jgi:TPR repeat protein